MTYGQIPNGEFGFAVAGTGDLDKDGTPDYVVGAPAAGTGYVYAYTGKTHAALWIVQGPALGDRMGYSLAGIGDFNGDGVDDVLVGAPGADSGSLIEAGAAYVLSGATGATLFTVAGTSVGGELGMSVAGIGDIDGDGRQEFAVGAPHEYPGGALKAGTVRVFSGATGAPLYTLVGQTAGDELGTSLAFAGDPNGDGRPDFVAGAQYSDSAGMIDTGSAFVHSGRRLAFDADRTVVSAATGGQIHFELDLGPGNGGRPYLVLGSASGTSPGVSFGAVNLPLNPDWFYAGTLQFVNTAVFTSFLGYLNGQGKATATFDTVLPVPAIYLGKQFHFAALVGNPLDFASNAVPIEIMP